MIGTFVLTAVLGGQIGEEKFPIKGSAISAEFQT